MRLCVKTRVHHLIVESFKVILEGKVSVFCAKEVTGWVPDIGDDDTARSEDGSDNNSVGINKWRKKMTMRTLLGKWRTLLITYRTLMSNLRTFLITWRTLLNGLTSDFADFVKNYNMHNMRKTIGEIHALLIEYEKGLPKKAATPQVPMIQGGRIQKPNKKTQAVKGKGKGEGKGKNKLVYAPKPKNLKPAAKEHPKKDDDSHHYKEVGH
ncbi:hypothetical protein Tco_0815049 [Tanacetum coccineum]